MQNIAYTWFKSVKRYFIFLIIFIASCIDPYVPDLRDYKSLLVVDGLITNENKPHSIRLSRTINEENTIPEFVNDAAVSIIDGTGNVSVLQNTGNGYYITDSTTFLPFAGQNYTLNIITSEGRKYESESTIMYPVAGIDTVFYEKGEEILGSQGQSFTGLKIFVSSEKNDESNQYFRWTYEEEWRFKIPFQQKYKYLKINENTVTFREVPQTDDGCWKKNLSTEIITNSTLSSVTKFIDRQQVNFIAPVRSDRLTDEYSILVKQYSISKKEYDFWNNLENASESGGDIFASQPYTVISNIHNVNDPDEIVLGYFEVSAVSQKRIFITSKDIEMLDLPDFSPDCLEFKMSPEDYPDPKPTWDQLYNMFMNEGSFVFIGPVLTEGTVPEGSVYTRDIIKYIFATKKCSLCELTGSSDRPEYWEEPEQ